MLTRAQCEKAVTISEPIGHAREGLRASLELASGVSVRVQLSMGRNPVNVEPLAPSNLRLVFNDLRVGAASKGERFRSPLQYLSNRAFVLLRGGWFGPSFVTIMPTGVGVCSF
jgi:hypothetical protein